MDEVSLKSAPARYRFDRFLLDVGDRRLMAGDKVVELNSRYFDALALLVRERGKLVPKQRFLDEVWRGVPVTDEALTQCIKTLRRQLGDDAARPRFIETVPKHGYRFIAAMDPAAPVQPIERAPRDWNLFRRLGLAGTLGGAFAGMIGGLIYGFAAASQPQVGGISVLLVLLSITALMGLLGGAGVAFGIAFGGICAEPGLALEHARRRGGRRGGRRAGQAAWHRRVQPAGRPRAGRNHRERRRGQSSAVRSGWAPG